MTSISVCNDTSDAVELFTPQALYLKPIAKIHISVQLPQLKSPGKSISNWEVMEKLKKMVRPEQLQLLKVAKSTLEFIRFEAEIESRSKLANVLGRLDCKTIKLSGFPDALKVRAAEAKPNFPSRHDWESYFRDAKNMNEMRPGERPDTIHFLDLPSKWFANRKDINKTQPSEYMLRKVFETFGEVRCVDIPMLDPYRKENNGAGMNGSITTFKFDQDIVFEAYVQYREYISFVKAMTSLKGMKLMFKSEDGKALCANIKASFDTVKHLSDKNIKRRRLERERMQLLEEQREARVRNEREEEQRRQEEERRQREQEERERLTKKEEKLRVKEERRRVREEKRRQKRQEKKRKLEEQQMQMRISMEERRILVAQRKLETIRLLAELFNRIKVAKQAEEVERQERELEEERKKQIVIEKERKLQEEKRKLDLQRRRKERLERQEKELREKILKNMKLVEERQAEVERESLRKRLAGSKRLQSVMVPKR